MSNKRDIPPPMKNATASLYGISPPVLENLDHLKNRSVEAAPSFQLLWLGIEDGRAKSLFHEHPTTFVTLNSQSPWPMLLMITTVKYLMRKNGTLTRHPFGIWKAGPCKIQYSPYNP